MVDSIPDYSIVTDEISIICSRYLSERNCRVSVQTKEKKIFVVQKNVGSIQAKKKRFQEFFFASGFHVLFCGDVFSPFW
jgi:hypothetical protein